MKNAGNKLLGIDLGSSSVKVSLVDAASGEQQASAFCPKQEMEIKSIKIGWAEQNPEAWWSNLKAATREAFSASGVKASEVKAIGLSYQMHGLVLVDEHLRPLRDAIIWCDSRAVPYGQQAFEALGSEQCLPHLLNSPGNFTLAKLAWVKDCEPTLYARARYFMLPGDYLAMRLTGKVCTTASGLSEGIGWDFAANAPAKFLFDYFGFDTALIPELTPTFGVQGYLSKAAAVELGLAAGTPITYRAGDQPNNALSLNVLHPGEVAATAGTSGVVYGVNGKAQYDPLSRVNSFAHVNHSAASTRIGVLLCINGAAILNAWMKRNIAPNNIDYATMNELAAVVPVGCEGLSIAPFGNGAERMLCNREAGCSVHGLSFNRHGKAHLIRAAQEGIAFAFRYGMEVMNAMGIETTTIRAGYANLFLSPIFRQTLANITGATIELYNTDGAAGAARGAGIGAGIYASEQEAFASLKKTHTITPQQQDVAATVEAYERWRKNLKFEI
ncbi:MAG: carbohydrate kinase [Prevotellaceae bacterium]|jgi:xylulokinase|nr:carbohydrate kinase [Prevotellaceae bacterium]